MPALAPDDQCVLRGDIRVPRDALPGVAQYPGLLLAPAQVFRVELLGELPRLAGQAPVRCEQETRRQVRRIHPPGRVYAGRQYETHFFAANLVLPRQAAHVQQRLQPDRVGAAAQPLQAQTRNHPVLPGERHHVSNRPDCRQLEKRRHPFQVAGLHAQAVHQLEGDPHASKILVRIRAVETPGVDHGKRRRQVRLRLVMVGDDEVYPELRRPPAGRLAPYPAVDRHHDAHAHIVQALDARGLQAVTIPEPLGDEVHDVAAEQFHHPAQHHRRRDAVNVIVAVHRNAFLAGDGGQQSFNTGRQVGQQERVVQLIKRRMQKAGRRLGGVYAAQHQQPRHNRIDVERTRQIRNPRVIARQMLPNGSRTHHGADRPGSSAGASRSPLLPISRNFAYRCSLRAVAESAATLSSVERRAGASSAAAPAGSV